MAYGKHISQVDRKERKLYSGRTPKARTTQPDWNYSPELARICVELTGMTPGQLQALQMAGITQEQASEPVDLTSEAADQAAMYSDLRHGG